MIITKQKSFVVAVSLLGVMGLSQIILESVVHARAGSGRTAGSRGSRSYQAPTRPTQPVAPPREATPPQSQQSIPQAPPPQPGGFMRGLGTAMLGGFLGSLLFSGVAHAGLGGSGIGLIEILLLAGIGYFIFRLFRVRAAATEYGSLPYEDSQDQASSTARYSNALPVQESLPLNGIDYRALTLMDRSFTPEQFVKTAQNLFFRIQGAWNKQDTVTLRAACGADLMKSWDEEIAQLKARGQKNRMDNIALRESEITEVWTENGQDFITVRFFANLLDYTVDDKGAVINGSDSESVEFEEFWTFTRPVGPNEWKLTAVQQG